MALTQQQERNSSRTTASGHQSTANRWSASSQNPFNENQQVVFPEITTTAQQQQQQRTKLKQRQQDFEQRIFGSSDTFIMAKPHSRRRKKEQQSSVQGTGRGNSIDAADSSDSSSDDNGENSALASRSSKKSQKSFVIKFCLKLIKIIGLLFLISLFIYLWPIDGPPIEAQVAPERPMPNYSAGMAQNELLDEAEALFAGQFNAPESMAWTKDKRSFYTGVEGGFILRVEPYEERWTLVARLNARNSIIDLSPKLVESSANIDGNNTATSDSSSSTSSEQRRWAPFCTSDIELYGHRAEFEPRLVALSRCSRPLGIRLSPDDTYLYVSDPLSGIFRIDLKTPSAPLYQWGQVSKLIDFTSFQADSHKPLESQSADRVLFADDIAVVWASNNKAKSQDDGDRNDQKQLADLIYLTDCSRKYTLRYLLPMMIEYDDSGRVLEFNTESKRFKPIYPTAKSSSKLSISDEITEKSRQLSRKLSFPNGLEISANQSALIISDLNNRRLLMHHLRGPLTGQTNHLLWLPGYPDNVRRGLDLPDGRATYWLACGCSRAESYLEPTESFNNYPMLRYLALKFVRLLGAFIETIGRWSGNSAWLMDTGLAIRTIWLRNDLICGQSFVAQVDETGQVLRSLHAPHFLSPFKLLSEAHEVPLLEQPRGQLSGNNGGATNSSISADQYRSALYLGSVYYAYLGRAYLRY